MSDEDIDAGPILGGEVAPAPSETPRAPIPEAPDEKTRTEQIREQFNAGLGLMAHGTESAEDFIKERKIQERFLADEDISGAQMQEWHQRTHSALQRAADAAARARGEIPPSQQQASEENIPGYVAPDDPNYDAIIEANKGRFSEYFDDPERTGNSASWQDHKQAHGVDQFLRPEERPDWPLHGITARTRDDGGVGGRGRCHQVSRQPTAATAGNGDEQARGLRTCAANVGAAEWWLPATAAAQSFLGTAPNTSASWRRC